MNQIETTKERFIQDGGGIIREEVFCKLTNSQTNKWERMLKGDKRICNGKADCLNAHDEESCDAFQIEIECTEEVCSNFQSKTFSLTPLERNGPRKGAFRSTPKSTPRMSEL